MRAYLAGIRASGTPLVGGIDVRSHVLHILVCRLAVSCASDVLSDRLVVITVALLHATAAPAVWLGAAVSGGPSE